MPRDEMLTGKKKISIFLLAMGPDIASRLLKMLPEQEIENISMEVANLSMVKKEVRDEIIDEFLLLAEAQQVMLEGGVEMARELLEKTLGHNKATEIIKRLKEQIKVKPFSFVRHTEPKQLVNMISGEHPQTIALILSYLDTQQAAMILSDLPMDVQADIAKRVALMDRTSPEILKEVEDVLREKVTSIFQQDFTQAGGIDAVVGILNSADRGTEKLILEEL